MTTRETSAVLCLDLAISSSSPLECTLLFLRKTCDRATYYIYSRLGVAGWEMPIESRVEVSRSCRRSASERTKGEGTVRGPKVKQLIANRHGVEPDGDVPRPRASLCGVSHDRERAMTPARGARPREKSPPDGYLNAAVCMRVRYVAVHRGLESKPRNRAGMEMQSRAGSRRFSAMTRIEAFRALEECETQLERKWRDEGSEIQREGDACFAVPSGHGKRDFLGLAVEKTARDVIVPLRSPTWST